MKMNYSYKALLWMNLTDIMFSERVKKHLYSKVQKAGKLN